MSTEELESIKSSLHRIEQAIMGDGGMGTKGLAQRVNDLEATCGGVERKMLVWGGVFTGASIVLTHLKVKLFG